MDGLWNRVRQEPILGPGEVGMSFSQGKDKSYVGLKLFYRLCSSLDFMFSTFRRALPEQRECLPSLFVHQVGLDYSSSIPVSH